MDKIDNSWIEEEKEHTKMHESHDTHHHHHPDQRICEAFKQITIKK